jgi:hypothetical protein
MSLRRGNGLKRLVMYPMECDKQTEGHLPTCITVRKARISKLGQMAGEFLPTHVALHIAKLDIVIYKRKSQD